MTKRARAVDCPRLTTNETTMCYPHSRIARRDIGLRVSFVSMLIFRLYRPLLAIATLNGTLGRILQLSSDALNAYADAVETSIWR